MYKPNRSRSLASLTQRLGASFDLERSIQTLRSQREHVDVLELGFGYGHALMELAHRFRSDPVRLHGVDKRPNVISREALLDIARDFDVAPASELSTLELPDIHAYDATSLHFPDESMDFVYSAFVLRFIPRKDLVLQEVCRVLRPGGHAVIHIGGDNWNYPYGQALAAPLLTMHMSRFVLRFANELIPIGSYLELFQGGAFRFDFAPSHHCILRIRKLASGTLDLALDYDDRLSLAGRAVPLRNRKGEVKGGIRSVFNLRDDMYDALFERDILTVEYLRHARRANKPIFRSVG